jgi:glucose-6-phosphate 1-dehydrogenase
VVSQLEKSGCAKGAHTIVEKPFGTNLSSAKALNHILSEVFDESSIYRIDHCLGKRAVYNMLFSVLSIHRMNRSGIAFM